MDSAILRWCSDIVFATFKNPHVWKKKNPCVSGPVQFKPELFKSELYFKILESLPLFKSKLSITGHKDRIALSHSFIVGKK